MTKSLTEVITVVMSLKVNLELLLCGSRDLKQCNHWCVQTPTWAQRIINVIIEEADSKHKIGNREQGSRLQPFQLHLKPKISMYDSKYI